MCYAICGPLHTLLGMHGVEADLMGSDLGLVNHVWLLPDGRVLDPILDQFDSAAPAVYLGEETEWHRNASVRGARRPASANRAGGGVL